MPSIKSEILVGLVSLTASADKTRNIQKALSASKTLCMRSADWVCLPEMFSYHGPYDLLWDHAEAEDGSLNEALSKFAKDNKIVLFAGSVPERSHEIGEKKVFNTQYVFGRDGSLLAKYRKTHLFNLMSPTGEPLYCESDGYLAGDAAVSFTVDGWRVGLATCYDLRFPEFFAAITRHQPVDCLVIPSAFTQQTGMYHWKTLLCSRAIENLCYVAAANQTGTHSPGKTSYGHALVVDPWGTVVADSGNTESNILTEMCHDKVSFYRSLLPSIKNRRPELYR
jgi:deaminated glutathione amidase